MHELGLVFHMVDLLEKVGEENERTHIQRVVLDLGEVSGVLEDQLQDCWKWASAKSELLAGAVLEVNQLEAVTICNDCGRTYPTVAHGRICPHCESPNTVLVSGNQMEVREVEAW